MEPHHKEPGDPAQDDPVPGDPAPGPTPYERAQHKGQEALRRALLDAASGLLLEEGPGALTMRRVAGAGGCSTTVLYTMFGGKEGLADALYREGFERLGHPLGVAGASLEVLTQAVRAAMEAGMLRAGDPRAVAEVLWAAVHGVVSLELAGHFPDPDVAADRFQTLAS